MWLLYYTLITYTFFAKGIVYVCVICLCPDTVWTFTGIDSLWDSQQSLFSARFLDR